MSHIQRIVTRSFIHRRCDSFDTRHRTLLDRCTCAQSVRHTALSTAEHTSSCDTGYLIIFNVTNVLIPKYLDWRFARWMLGFQGQQW